MDYVIAIDGPAGSGKSTIAKLVARSLGWSLIDTGAMYRAVAWLAINSGENLEREAAVTRLAHSQDLAFRGVPGGIRVLYRNTELTDAELRSEVVGQGASVVSQYGGVRQVLSGAQRELGATGRVVMEGRDIGTVIFPNAGLKVYLTADDQERARRRQAQLKKDGVDVPMEQLLEEIRVRDQRDRERTLAPLIQAPDAVLIESTGVSPDVVVEQITLLATNRGLLPSHSD